MKETFNPSMREGIVCPRCGYFLSTEELEKYSRPSYYYLNRKKYPQLDCQCPRCLGLFFYKVSPIGSHLSDLRTSKIGNTSRGSDLSDFE